MSRAVPSESDVVKKAQIGTAIKIVRKCPPSITAYRQNMGGVDTNDQTLSYDNLSRKSYRWWLPIFLELFKQGIVNAWILQSAQPNSRKRGLKSFQNRTVPKAYWEVFFKKKIISATAKYNPKI
eukprot:gene16150-7515_t